MVNSITDVLIVIFVSVRVIEEELGEVGELPSPLHDARISAQTVMRMRVEERLITGCSHDDLHR